MIIQGNDPTREPSFSLSNRLRRFAWGYAYIILFRYSPRPCHVWRSWILRLFGARLGKGCHIYPKVKIWAPWNLRFGDFVGIGDDVTLYSMDFIKIGEFSVISQGAYLCAGTHDFNSKNFQIQTKPILIGVRVWVCAEAFIHPGIVISDGVVVGARAVVTKSLLEAWMVYSGNPCKRIGIRVNHTSDKFPISNRTISTIKNNIK